MLFQVVVHIHGVAPPCCSCGRMVLGKYNVCHSESERVPQNRLFLFKHIFIWTGGIFLILTHFDLDFVAPPELFLSLCSSSLSPSHTSALFLFLIPPSMPACHVLHSRLVICWSDLRGKLEALGLMWRIALLMQTLWRYFDVRNQLQIWIYSNKSNLQLIVQPCCNKIMLWTSRQTMSDIVLSASEFWVRSHSTLPMPSSAGSSTQQAAWPTREPRLALCQLPHLCAADTSSMSDLQEAPCARDTIWSSGSRFV